MTSDISRDLRQTLLYDAPQTIGLWEKRGASSQFITIALGQTSMIQNPRYVDKMGYHLWHYWAESPEPEILWDGLRMQVDEQLDLIVADQGEHPLHRLLLKGKTTAALLWLNEAKWDPSMLNGQDTFWHCIAWSGSSHLLQSVETVLHQHGLNQKDDYGRTPVVIAAHRGDKKFVQHWLFLGSDPNIQDQTGKTLLHHVAQYGDIEWFSEIQDLGADDTIKDERHRTAYDILQDKMKHGTSTDIEILKLYWEKLWLQKIFF